MAITKNTFTGNGTTVLYSFSFPYLDESHVKATLNGTPTTAFTFANATTLQFNSAPGAGVEIVIFRETDSDQSEAVFAAGSPIRAADLNQNNTQLLYVAQENVQGTGEANATANLALTTANTAETNSLAAISTANQADSNASAAVITANTAESNSLAAVSTANTASSNASAAVSTANAASSAASAAVITANAASSTASQAAIDAAAAVVTANAADGKADAAVLTANAADAAAAAAVITANAADVNASAAVVTANTAESNSLSAISTANSAAAAVAAAVLYQPVVDLAALALLTPLDGEFFELQDSTGADTDPSITGVPVGLVGSAGLTFRLRYDDPPGEYVFLGYFANDSETRYLKTGTGTVTSTNILDGTIVNADVNASAAIAGTKISPNFGSQAVTTTGLISANGKVSFPLGTAALPSLYPGTDTNTGIYSPGADQLAISTNGTERARIDSSGKLLVGTDTARTNIGPSINTNPQFQIEGTTTNGSSASIIRNSASNAAPQFNLAKTRGSSVGSIDAVIAGDVLGVIQFQGSDGVNFYRGGQIQVEVDSTPGTASMPGRLVFSTSSSGSGSPTERMRLDSTGRLGLGSSSPDALLTVNGVGAHGLGSVTAPSFAFTGDLNTGFWSPAADTLAASTGGSERARIDSSGRVLIGTTTADTSGNALLQVNGSIKGTITSGTAVASTSGTSIDFTGIPSWVKKITVMFDEVSTNGNGVVLVQLGDSGGIETNNYASVGSFIATTGGVTTSGSGGYTDGFVIFASSSGTLRCGLLTIALVSGNKWTSGHSMAAILGSTAVGLHGGGIKTLSATLDRIRITTDVGTDTFNGGSINILYEG